MTLLWQAPVIVVSFVVWFASPPDGLADISVRETLRREFTANVVHTLTTADLPVTSLQAIPVENGAAVSGESAAPDPLPSGHDRAWWRDRLAAAEAAVDRSRAVADALQTRLNALAGDIAGRDDPYQRAELEKTSQKGLVELQSAQQEMRVNQRAVDEIKEEGRKAGVPPGWLR